MPIDPRMVTWDDAPAAAAPPKIDPRMVRWGDVEPAQPAFEDPGMLMAGVIGAGRAADRIVKGVQQIYYGATGNERAQADLKARAEADDAAYRPLAQARPWSTGAGSVLPAMALAPLSGGSSLLAQMGTAAAVNAIPAALEYGTANERAGRALVAGAGGASGAAAGNLIARALMPAGRGASPVASEVMDAAARIGYRPTPAQLTQSPSLGNIENYLLRTPGGSGAMQKVQAAQQTALNRAAARAMGENADDLGEAVFAGAQSRLGAEFGRLGEVTAPVLGDDFLGALARVDAANKARGAFANPRIDKLVDQGMELAASGKLTGTAYKEIRSELASQAQAAFKSGDSTVGQAFKTITGALDDAAKASLSKTDQQAWDLARKQWSAFKTLSKGNVAEGGNVSAARVAAQLRQQGPALRTGAASGDLADIARIGEAFKGTINPNSSGLLTTAMFGNPVTGIPMGLVNKGLAGLYTSGAGQRYLSRGLLDLTPKGELALIRAAGLLSSPAAQGLLGVE